MNDIVKASKNALTAKETPRKSEQVFVTVYVDDQLFGIPVEIVQDILIPEHIANIPLAPAEVAGVINLRGRIVTVVDVRKRLGLPPRPEGEKKCCTTVEHGHDLYSLMVDAVGAVIPLALNQIEPNPSTLNATWRSVTRGVAQLEKDLMLVMDVEELLSFQTPAGK